MLEILGECFVFAAEGMEMREGGGGEGEKGGKEGKGKEGKGKEGKTGRGRGRRFADSMAGSLIR